MPQDKVFSPGPNRIFVFGSNLAGVHGAGAAKTAFNFYGAKWGQGEGMQGHSYAIPTKNNHLETLPIETITGYVETFLEYAWNHQEFEFFVTRIGCGLAGYEDKEIAPLFSGAPVNCDLPHGWRRPEEL